MARAKVSALRKPDTAKPTEFLNCRASEHAWIDKHERQRFIRLEKVGQVSGVWRWEKVCQKCGAEKDLLLVYATGDILTSEGKAHSPRIPRRYPKGYLLDMGG